MTPSECNPDSWLPSSEVYFHRFPHQYRFRRGDVFVLRGCTIASPVAAVESELPASLLGRSCYFDPALSGRNESPQDDAVGPRVRRVPAVAIRKRGALSQPAIESPGPTTLALDLVRATKEDSWEGRSVTRTTFAPSLDGQIQSETTVLVGGQSSGTGDRPRGSESSGGLPSIVYRESAVRSPRITGS